MGSSVTLLFIDTLMRFMGNFRKPILFFNFLFLFVVCAYVYMCTHMNVKVIGQLVGVSSPHPPCGIQG